MRSVEVDGFLGRFLGHLLVVLMDLEAQTLSESRCFLCSIDLYWFREPAFIKKMFCLARDGSIVEDFVAEKID